MTRFTAGGVTLAPLIAIKVPLNKAPLIAVNLALILQSYLFDNAGRVVPYAQRRRNDRRRGEPCPRLFNELTHQVVGLVAYKDEDLSVTEYLLDLCTGSADVLRTGTGGSLGNRHRFLGGNYADITGCRE